MKVVIPMLLLSNLIVASAAIARDAKEVLRNNSAFCDQFLIYHPDPRVVFSYMRDCCALSQNIHDCQMYDWGTIERW